MVDDFKKELDLVLRPFDGRVDQASAHRDLMRATIKVFVDWEGDIRVGYRYGQGIDLRVSELESILAPITLAYATA